jgi:3-dehydroquinate synthase
MKKITITFPAQPHQAYAIHIFPGAIGEIASLHDFGRYSKLFIVTDETIQPLLLDKLVGALPTKPASIVLPTGEQQKNIGSIQKIWTAMLAAGCDRRSLVINLGGGVVGDLGGFAASTYMRGVDFLNIPTTLLAQVDASVGGKTGFNFDGVKNLIGTFNQPVAVIIDPSTLDELPEREFLSGFAEIIKHGLVADAEYFRQLTVKPPPQLNPAELEAIIARSCHIKTAIVQSDVAEGGSRRLVNFGHTVGHAVEVLSLETDQPLLHGEAVSIGMRAEAIISERLGLLAKADLQQIEQSLAKAGLPVTIPGTVTTGDIMKKMRSDKKNDNGNLNFTLLDAIGHAVYNQHVEAAVILAALEATRQKP